jgi:putative transposase
MQAAGIKARHKRRKQPGQILAVVHSIAPNLLDRQFEATGPNQKWAADFTYVWTAEGWLFVAVVLDLYSRRVVGWSMQSTMSAQLVMDALLMAIFRRGRPQGVLHHSDQGSQGGFNRSSQHLYRGRGVYGTTGGMDAEIDRSRNDALARCTVTSA